MDNVNKEAYLVTLEIIIGEYEKHIDHLVEAESVEEAHTRAFEMEQHCDSAEWNEDMEAFMDCNDEMAYRVIKCVLVPWDDAVILRKYL